MVCNIDPCLCPGGVRYWPLPSAPAVCDIDPCPLPQRCAILTPALCPGGVRYWPLPSAPAVCDIGSASFKYDMRRLSEILMFPKAWYRRSLARRLFLGASATEDASDSSGLHPSPPLHLLFTSSSPPLHLLFTSSSPPLHLLFTSSTAMVRVYGPWGEWLRAPLDTLAMMIPDRGTIVGRVVSPARQLVRFSHLNVHFLQNSEFIWNISPLGKQ